MIVQLTLSSFGAVIDEQDIQDTLQEVIDTKKAAMIASGPVSTLVKTENS